MENNNRVKNKITFIDLYAGVGGFHVALQKLGMKCVFASERDKHARKTYEHNFSTVSPELFESGNFAGDITEVYPNNIPDFDLLTAGFPCQPFSIAGKRKGFDDKRGGAFFDIVRIIKAKRPQSYFLENVKHLLTIDGGKTFSKMKESLEALGYSFHWKIVRACDFGLPQYRPRLFMVGFREKKIKFEFPQPIPLQKTMSDIFGGKCDKEIGRTLLASGYGGRIGDRMNCTEYMVDGVPKQLSIEQAKEMMGLPKNFSFPVSKTQAFKQLGNSVAINVIATIGKEINRALRKK